MAGTMSEPRTAMRCAKSRGSRAVSMCTSAAAARRSAARLEASILAKACSGGAAHLLKSRPGCWQQTAKLNALAQQMCSSMTARRRVAVAQSVHGQVHTLIGEGREPKGELETLPGSEAPSTPLPCSRQVQQKR